MPGRVAECLLRNTIERDPNIRWKQMLALDRHRYGDLRPCRHSLGDLVQQFVQPGLIQGGGTELEQQGAHFGRCATSEETQVFEGLPRCVLITLPQTWQDLGNQARGEEHLSDE